MRVSLEAYGIHGDAIEVVLSDSGVTIILHDPMDTKFTRSISLSWEEFEKMNRMLSRATDSLKWGIVEKER